MKQSLKVENLTKNFGTATAVHNLSFAVTPGEVLGVIGPNGAGKTTTIKMILGLLTPSGGRVQVLGKNISNPSVRQKIGYMPESPRFFRYLTGKELLIFVGELFQLGQRESSIRAEKLLEQVGLSEAGNRVIGEYSKGMLQRISLAQSLINQPELLFLDEPLDGLDPLGRIQMKELLLEVRKHGTAIVLNSHILSDVAQLCDTIAIMHKGTLLEFGATETLVPKNTSLESVFLTTINNAEHI